MFSNFEQVALVSGGNAKVFEMVLAEEEVALPQNGLFVKITILGKADENGKLMDELPYDIVVQPDGRQNRSWRQQQPDFPVYEVGKGQAPTYPFKRFWF
jgi:hypothetical protein